MAMLENDTLLTEDWEKWEHLQGLAQNYFIVSVTEDFDGLRIVVCDYYSDKIGNRKILINFDGYVAAYRNTNESYRLQLLLDRREKYPSGILSGAFFKVKNSLYLQWLSDQSFQIQDQFMHFVIMTDNVFFEIIAGFEPKVDFLNQDGELENPPDTEEKFIKWEPLKGLAAKYSLDEIIDREGKFEVILSVPENKKEKLRIVFDKSVHAYCKTSDRNVSKMIIDTNGRYEIGFYKKWTFFKVTNSLYLQWLVKESFILYDFSASIHFMLLFNDCSGLNILAQYEPKIEFFHQE